MAAAIDAWMGQRIPIRVTTELNTITAVLAPKANRGNNGAGWGPACHGFRCVAN